MQQNKQTYKQKLIIEGSSKNLYRLRMSWRGLHRLHKVAQIYDSMIGNILGKYPFNIIYELCILNMIKQVSHKYLI